MHTRKGTAVAHRLNWSAVNNLLINDATCRDFVGVLGSNIPAEIYTACCPSYSRCCAIRKLSWKNHSIQTHHGSSWSVTVNLAGLVLVQVQLWGVCCGLCEKKKYKNLKIKGVKHPHSIQNRG